MVSLFPTVAEFMIELEVDAVICVVIEVALEVLIVSMTSVEVVEVMTFVMADGVRSVIVGEAPSVLVDIVAVVLSCVPDELTPVGGVKDVIEGAELVSIVEVVALELVLLGDSVEVVTTGNVFALPETDVVDKVPVFDDIAEVVIEPWLEGEDEIEEGIVLPFGEVAVPPTVLEEEGDPLSKRSSSIHIVAEPSRIRKTGWPLAMVNCV